MTAREAYKVTDALRSREKSATDFEAWVPDSGVWVNRIMADSKSIPVTAGGQRRLVTRRRRDDPDGREVARVAPARRTAGPSWPARRRTTTAEARGGRPFAQCHRAARPDPADARGGRQAKDGDTLAAAIAKALSQRASDSDGQVLDTLPRDLSGTEQGNPKRNQALILSEQAAFAYNATADSGDDLDLFYPKDGSPVLDYPFALVDEPALTTDESRAALRFMTLLGEPDGRRILEKHGFRTDDDDIPDKLVTRAGGRAPQPYTEPPAEPVTDKEIEEALGMWTITVQSTRLTTVVDASASMSKPVPGTSESRMDVTKAALSAGSGHLHAGGRGRALDVLHEARRQARLPRTRPDRSGSATARPAAPSGTCCRRPSTA